MSKVQLKVENVQSIIETLIFDGKVEGIEDPRGPTFLVDLKTFRMTWKGGKSATLYRPTKISIHANNGFTQAPCSVCPVKYLKSVKNDKKLGF